VTYLNFIEAYVIISAFIFNVWLVRLCTIKVYKFVGHERRIYARRREAKRLGMTPNEYAAHLHMPVPFDDDK